MHLSEKPKKEGSSPKQEETDDKWTLEKGKDHKGVSGAGVGPTGQVLVAELWGPGTKDPRHQVPSCPQGHGRAKRKSGLQQRKSVSKGPGSAGTGCA